MHHGSFHIKSLHKRLNRYENSNKLGKTAHALLLSLSIITLIRVKSIIDLVIIIPAHEFARKLCALLQCN